MIILSKIRFFFPLLLLIITINVYTQAKSDNFLTNRLKLKSAGADYKNPGIANKTSSVLPISIGVLAAIYLLNPMVEYTDRKVYAGLTKEISVGWGKLGEHRTAIEYSMVFGGSIKHFLRFSYKYDVLLSPGIQPSHMLQGTGVVSVGAGYFTDFKGNGIFPELTYGYSIRNHKVLFFPHVKLRYTYMLTKDKSNILDLSFGVILGIANPFIDVDIKRKY